MPGFTLISDDNVVNARTMFDIQEKTPSLDRRRTAELVLEEASLRWPNARGLKTALEVPDETALAKCAVNLGWRYLVKEIKKAPECTTVNEYAYRGGVERDKPEKITARYERKETTLMICSDTVETDMNTMIAEKLKIPKEPHTC
jgi:hypothetical protein